MPTIFRNHVRAMPGILLSSILAAGLLLSVVLTVLAFLQPRLAERLVAVDEQVRMLDAGGQVVAGPTESLMLKGAPHPVRASDLIPEPDIIESYDRQREFFARQDAFAGWLRGLDSGEALAPSAMLPFEYWLQLLIGFAIFVVSAWIWALRPRALPNRLFGIAGLGVWLSAITAALYSTRWLALPKSLFLLLANINGLGATTYGVAMICLFLVYPVRLMPARILLMVPLVFGGWYGLGLFNRLGAPANEVPLITAVEMLLILLAVVAQFVCSRKNPLQRAAIRWVGVSTLIGSGLFICTVIVPVLLGTEPLIDQSYGFAFFLIVHLGVALGLRRAALFQSEQWAIALFRAVSFGLLLIGVDIALITVLGSLSGAAVLTLLLVLPFFYLPWRGFVQRWLFGNNRIEDLLEEVAHIALIGDAGDRARKWRGVFGTAFLPLQIEDAPPGLSGDVVIAEEGMVLLLPAAIDCPAMRLRYKNRGTRLFQGRDRQLAMRLIDLASSLQRQQEAFRQGVRSERSRISRDLHDDLAARLMSGLTLDDPDALKLVLRSSLAEVRSIVTVEEGSAGDLGNILADSRAEAAERLEAAGMELDWPLVDISGEAGPQQQKALTSILREIVTNMIRHSGGTRLSVGARLDNGRLYIVATDNGQRFDGTLKLGNGLRNMRARLAAIGGYFDFEADAGCGFRVSIAVPVAP